MAYVLPAMPLVVNVWTEYDPLFSAYATPDQHYHCNLSPGRRTMMFFPKSPGVGSDSYFPMELLLPPGADLRCVSTSSNGDLVECPAGSARFYSVQYVDDIAKGFANEHRLAMVFRMLTDINFVDAGFVPPWPLP